MEIKRYEFACEKACRSYSFGGRELWTITMKARELPLGMSFGPNARYADIKAKPAKEMLQTLESAPESFILKNNGIMIVADRIKVDGHRVELRCREGEETEGEGPGHGVLNGGHTYRVLEHALRSADPRFSDVAEAASIILTVATGVDDEEIPQISRARNTSQAVPVHALRELAGDWSVLKKHLPKASQKLVAFKPNDPDAFEAPYDVTDLVRRLVLIHNGMYPAERGEHPVQAYTSIGTLVKKFRQRDFLEVAPLLRDVLWLEERIYECWHANKGKGPDRIAITKASGVTTEPTQLISGATVQLSLPAPFVLPAIAAFRVFVRDGQWAENLDSLWDKYGPRTVSALWAAYREQGKSSPAIFGRSKSSWAATCDLTKSAAIQKGLLAID